MSRSLWVAHSLSTSYMSCCHSDLFATLSFRQSKHQSTLITSQSTPAILRLTSSVILLIRESYIKFSPWPLPNTISSLRIRSLSAPISTCYWFRRIVFSVHPFMTGIIISVTCSFVCTSWTYLSKSMTGSCSERSVPLALCWLARDCAELRRPWRLLELDRSVGLILAISFLSDFKVAKEGGKTKLVSDHICLRERAYPYCLTLLIQI